MYLYAQCTRYTARYDTIDGTGLRLPDRPGVGPPVGTRTTASTQQGPPRMYITQHSLPRTDPPMDPQEGHRIDIQGLTATQQGPPRIYITQHRLPRTDPTMDPQEGYSMDAEGLTATHQGTPGDSLVSTHRVVGDRLYDMLSQVHKQVCFEDDHGALHYRCLVA